MRRSIFSAPHFDFGAGLALGVVAGAGAALGLTLTNSTSKTSSEPPGMPGFGLAP
jgi:hypothetical protein